MSIHDYWRTVQNIWMTQSSSNATSVPVPTRSYREWAVEYLAPPIVRLTGEELTEYASAWKTTIGEKVFGRGRDMIITKEDCIKHINTHKTIYYCDNKPADSEIITRDTARKIIAENPDDLLLLTDQYESGHTIAIYCKRTLEEKRSYIWSMTLYES